VKLSDSRAESAEGAFLTALARSALCECLTIQKRFAEAERLPLESYHLIKKSKGAGNPPTQIARQRLAALYEAYGRSEEVEQHHSEITSR